MSRCRPAPRRWPSGCSKRSAGRSSSDDPRFRSNAARLQNRAAVEALVADFIAARSQAEALAFFEAAEVTVGPVCDEADLAAHPYVAEREVLVEVPDEQAGSLPMHNIVPRLSATPGALRRPAPALGEHNGEILRALGSREAEIARLSRPGCSARHRSRSGAVSDHLDPSRDPRNPGEPPVARQQGQPPESSASARYSAS